MNILNYIKLCVLMIFVINVSCSSSNGDDKKNSETVQTNNLKAEMNTEQGATVTEVNSPQAIENIAKGEKLFKENNCIICHQLNTKLIGPALKDVAKAYAGDKQKLNSFLKGDAKSIIDPAQHAIMEPQIAITKAMSEEDRMAIVEYLLSVK